MTKVAGVSGTVIRPPMTFDGTANGTDFNAQRLRPT